MRWSIVALASVLPLIGGDAAFAIGAEPWQVGFQKPATPIMERLQSFHTMLLVIMSGIVLLVMGLLGYAMWRFRESANPTPSKRSHNTVIEVVWTAVPVLILVIIAIPSFRILYFMDVLPETEMTIKAIGRQWYWSYEYPDHGNFTFDAYMIEEADLDEGQLRLYETDNNVVLPTDTNIRVQVTGGDVLHAFAMPSMGIKLDAIPGHLNELWLNIREPGIYYGQCSELCGVRHGFMPIAIEAVPPEEFEAWVKEAQETFANAQEEPVAVASSK